MIYYIKNEPNRRAACYKLLLDYGAKPSNAVLDDPEENAYYGFSDKDIDTFDAFVIYKTMYEPLFTKYKSKRLSIDDDLKSNVYIKGVIGRGNDVIEILKNYGARFTETSKDFNFENENFIFFLDSNNKVVHNANNNSIMRSIMNQVGYDEIFLDEKFRPGDFVTYMPNGLNSNLICGIYESYDKENEMMHCSCAVYEAGYPYVHFDVDMKIKAHEIEFAPEDKINKFKDALDKSGYVINKDGNVIKKKVFSFSHGEQVITRAEDGVWMVNIFSHVDKDGYARCLAPYRKSDKILPFIDEYKPLIGSDKEYN